MLLAVDVQYGDDDLAGVGAIVAESWVSSSPIDEVIDVHRGLASYVPGNFYRRELPCVLTSVRSLITAHPIKVIIVDGYVDVTPGHAGLGRHLAGALNEAIEIVGVAKSEFTQTHAIPVYRGASNRPLWVTSTASQEHAATNVLRMHGSARLPTLLRLVDRLARRAYAGGAGK